MDLYNNFIPILYGKLAKNFIKKSEDNIKRKGTINFSKEMENYLQIKKKKRNI